MNERLQIADVANQNSSKQLQMHVQGLASELVDAKHFSCMWRTCAWQSIWFQLRLGCWCTSCLAALAPHAWPEGSMLFDSHLSKFDEQLSKYCHHAVMQGVELPKPPGHNEDISACGYYV
ncbi:TPA: hypothetical protein ACH3X2_007988 [Trebouxia sp. C0005]